MAAAGMPFFPFSLISLCVCVCVLSFPYGTRATLLVLRVAGRAWHLHTLSVVNCGRSNTQVRLVGLRVHLLLALFASDDRCHSSKGKSTPRRLTIQTATTCLQTSG